MKHRSSAEDLKCFKKNRMVLWIFHPSFVEPCRKGVRYRTILSINLESVRINFSHLWWPGYCRPLWHKSPGCSQQLPVQNVQKEGKYYLLSKQIAKSDIVSFGSICIVVAYDDCWLRATYLIGCRKYILDSLLYS